MQATVKKITIEIAGDDPQRVQGYADIIVSQVRSAFEMMRVIQEASQREDSSMKPLSMDVYES